MSHNASNTPEHTHLHGFLLIFLCLAYSGSVLAEPIRIATFNIQILGKTKMGKPAVVSELVSVVRQYDIVAVQEIKDASNKTPGNFLTTINAETGSTFAVSLGPRTGNQPDDKHSKEQYAYYYNTDTIRKVGTGQLYNESSSDHFQREPYVAKITDAGGNFDFVLISIHTKPERTVQEIDALHHVVEWARTQYPAETDYIVLGDYNANCNYATKAQIDNTLIAGNQYNWIVPRTPQHRTDPYCNTSDRNDWLNVQGVGKSAGVRNLPPITRMMSGLAREEFVASGESEIRLLELWEYSERPPMLWRDILADWSAALIEPGTKELQR